MADRPKGIRRLMAAAIVLVALVLAAAVYVWRDDILRTRLDPKEPFQTYDPPPAPDYAQRSAWALMPNAPEAPTAGEPPADVFFVGPTTFDGGRHWNAPIDDPKADRLFRQVMAPNYAGPFVRVGRIFAPRYRQASLYTLMTLRDDAREARRFAYGDVAQAFRYYVAHYNLDRPFVIVGVEQGGTLATRLIAEEVAANPTLRARLAAAYLVQTVVPSDNPPLPPCLAPKQTGCLAAWASVYDGEPERAQALLDRSLVWNDVGQLVNLGSRTPICFNPLFGAVVDAEAPARLNLGATNATGLEWGARPAFLTRQVGAKCDKGILRVTRPKSPSLKPSGSWTDRRRAPGYNVFFADLEADAGARVAALAEPGTTPAD
ncbi:DUF3089 domain-containing protein [Phenylobacterium sp. NIBR 498073]|uniref:DUF3089 domain-containing protein n=1 Tax=Phenylobacterium sp. NIBR 498073 TaxID=3015177 RepID=UPI0022B53E20|nr:DUF3089 domain-containing protein [Phenylobacterium sp. NIBR 498073]WGU38437.1 DUF3089 domain-containing protein [Phenylobacterium sp. NIBR 498073]